VKSILVVCIENACRSQMAEGFAQALADFPLKVSSAGTRPAEHVDPNAVKVMAEAGIDISHQRPQGIDRKALLDYDAVITMGCGAEGICPAHFPGVTEDWQIPDPHGGSIDEYRRLPDLILKKVKTLLGELGGSVRLKEET